MYNEQLASAPFSASARYFLEVLVTTTVRVVVADDYPVVVHGLPKLLLEEAPVSLVGSARSFKEVIEVLTQVEADVLVLDLSGMNGSPLAIMSRLRREHPSLGIVIYSSQIDFAPEMLDAGARGFVTKDEAISEVVKAILAAAEGKRHISPLVQEYLDQTTKDTLLTERELTALNLLAQGKSTAEIAEAMGIHIHTAQNHITALRRKTGCSQRVLLVEWYRARFNNM